MSQKNKKHIVFCFPYRGVGGVANQFLRLANELSRGGEFNISIVDYIDGFMSINNSNDKVKLIEYSGSIDVHLPTDAIIIFQAMTPWSIFPSLIIPDDCKIFFWQCHPFNFIPTIPILSGMLSSNITCYRYFIILIFNNYWRALRKFHLLLRNTKSLVYIDDANSENTRIFLNIADEIELTRVHADFDADTFFPEINSHQWKEVWREEHTADEKHAHAFTFLRYQKI